LDSLLSLVAIARRRVLRPNGTALILPWVNLHVQLRFRELKRMVATVEPRPQLLYSDDLTPEQAKKTLPVMHYRDCGATGWGGIKPAQGSTKLVANDLQRFYREYFGHKLLVTFAFPVDHPHLPNPLLLQAKEEPSLSGSPRPLGEGLEVRYIRKLCSECLTLKF
jgi:DEAD/DEAH box helicase domain-containing protein